MWFGIEIAWWDFMLGRFLNKLWKCVILRANFVHWFDSVDFWVFSGVYYWILCIVMGKTTMENDGGDNSIT